MCENDIQTTLDLPQSDLFLSQAIDAVIITDSNFKITYINPAFEAMFGYSLEDLSDQTPSIFNVEPMAPEIQNEIYQTMRKGKAWVGTAQNLRKDGSLFLCEMKIFPIRPDSKGKFVYGAIQRDVTERVRMLEDKNKLLDELQERNKELNCLYDFSQFADKKNSSLGEIFQYLVDLIPSGMQFPNDCCSRIIVNSDTYTSPKFKETKWKLVVEQQGGDLLSYKLETFYLKEFPTISKDPFRKEEKDMVSALAENLANIIKREHYKRELLGANRALNIIDKTNRQIVKSSSLSSFLKNICKFITEIDDYKMAWIGRIDKETTQKSGTTQIKIVTQHGDSCSYIKKNLVDQNNITVDDISTATINHQKPVISVPGQTDPLFEPWRLKAQKYGYQSSISLPLTVSGKVYGILAIYSLLPDAFAHKQNELLEKLAVDISFGIEFLNIKVAKENSKQQVEHYQKQLSFLLSKLIATKEHERRQIATDLHDRIGQNLAISKINLSMLKDQSICNEAKKIATEVTGHIDQVIKNTRDMIAELSPSILYELGLGAAIEWLSDHFTDQYGIPIEYTYQKPSEKPAVNLNDDMKIFAFRSVHELLINSIKHSKSNLIKVNYFRDSKIIRLAVSDNGIGYCSHNKIPNSMSGFGLFSIKERIKHFKGEIIFDCSTNKGYNTTIILPIVNCVKHDNLEERWNESDEVN